MQDSILEIKKMLEEIVILMKLQNKTALENTLREVAKTDERKKMWLMFDGKTKIKDIAKATKKDERTVQIFVKDLERLGLVEPIRSTPKRKIDFIPSNWITLQSEVKKNGEVRKTEQNDNVTTG